MAALRKLILSLTKSSGAGTLTTRKLSSSRATKVLAAGACVAAAAGAAGAAYYYSFVGRRSGLANRVEARLVHLALPSVSATDKVQ